jgi:hypothetical protein
MSDRRCTICGALLLGNGVCSLVGSGQTLGCPDPTHDYRVELEAALAARRESLIGKFLFASRDLADFNLGCFHDAQAAWRLRCNECRKVAITGKIHHSGTCRTGRVVELLDQLCALEEEPAPIRKEHAQTEELPRAEVGMPSGGEFGEPWTNRAWENHAKDCLRNSHDEHVAQVFSLFNSAHPIADREIVAERIAACVNFCAGISTEMLAAQKPLADMSRPIGHVVQLRQIIPGLPEVARG